MKIARAVLYILGIILTLLNIASVINTNWAHVPRDSAERTGYILAMIFFFIPGLVCILIARSITRKIRREKNQALVNSLPG